MPHTPQKHVDCEVFSNPTATGGAMIELDCDHPDRPGAIVGQIVRNSDYNYTVFVYDEEDESLKITLGIFTSIKCAIANIEYRDGRLTKKRQKEFDCPDCGETVKSVMVYSLLHTQSNPRLVDIVKVMIVVDEWGNGKYQSVVGYQVHECEYLQGGNKQ